MTGARKGAPVPLCRALAELNLTQHFEVCGVSINIRGTQQIYGEGARLASSSTSASRRPSSIFGSAWGACHRRLEAEGIWTSIWYQEAHHSTALEGNTLVIAQVEALLAEGRAVGNKELREYMEVTGYADAAKWVYGQALEPGDWTSQAPLMMTEVRHVHELALGPVWGVSPHPNATPEEKPGSFRRHDIQPFPSGMVPPPWVEVPAAMVDWVDSLATITASDNPVEAIAAAHASFEKTHPFLDGNGRTGRLLLNLLLIRLGYPPAIIYTRDRNRYLRALRRADNGDPGTSRGAHRPGGDRQPLPLHRPRGGRAPPVGSDRLAGDEDPERVHASRRYRAGPAQGAEGTGWPMAEHPRLGRRIRRQQVPAGVMT